MKDLVLATLKCPAGVLAHSYPLPLCIRTVSPGIIQSSAIIPGIIQSGALICCFMQYGFYKLDLYNKH